MSRIFLMSLVVVGLAACQSTQPAMEASLSDDFGQAVRANIDAMAIAPTADELNNRFIPADRRRTERALEDYREGEIDDLKGVGTGDDN